MAVNEQDRLSSLPDDILIGIISRLPFKSAMDTALLSIRWRGFWRNLTSFHISTHKFQFLFNFFSVLDKLIAQITSPCIHTFRLDFWPPLSYADWQNHDCWLRQICNRNVKVLTLRWHSPFISTHKFPSIIFQTRSLISLEFSSIYGANGGYMPHDCDQIDLPNLKNLSLDNLYFGRPNESLEFLENLIKSLPSLEDLSLKSLFIDESTNPNYIKCSNENLRRLSIDLCSTKMSRVIINAPNLEYLDVLNVAFPNNAIFFSEVEPVVLREAKIKIIRQGHFPSNGGNILISNVLTLDDVFHRVISVKLRVNIMPENIEPMFSKLDLWPQLNVLTLEISEIWNIYKHRVIFPKLSNVNPLRRVVRRIDIETDWMSYEKRAKSFLEFVRYLLSNAMVLKHFQFRVAGHESIMLSVEKKRRKELEFCDWLYKYQIASAKCEVKFIGQYIEMSYEAGSRGTRKFG